jgi:hypothetical protein
MAAKLLRTGLTSDFPRFRVQKFPFWCSPNDGQGVFNGFTRWVIRPRLLNAPPPY